MVLDESGVILILLSDESILFLVIDICLTDLIEVNREQLVSEHSLEILESAAHLSMVSSEAVALRHVLSATHGACLTLLFLRAGVGGGLSSDRILI